MNYFMNAAVSGGVPGSTPVSMIAIVMPLPSNLGYLLRKVRACVSASGTRELERGNSCETSTMVGKFPGSAAGHNISLKLS